MPRRPTGLYPAQQRTWDRNLENRKAILRSIHGGKYHAEAHLAALAHNIEAYRTAGDWDALDASQSELQMLIEHRSRLALLAAQRRSAERVATAAERLADAAEREARAAEEAAATPYCPQSVVVVEKTDPTRCPPVVVPSRPCPPVDSRSRPFSDHRRSR